MKSSNLIEYIKYFILNSSMCKFSAKCRFSAMASAPAFLISLYPI